MNTREILEIKYPFILVDSDFDKSTKLWRPGTRFWTEMYSEYEGETFNECDAEGLMILRVIGVFKPDFHQERTFFKRHWKLPNGELSGEKSGLKIITSKAFDLLKKGYRFDYEINTSDKKNGKCK